VPEIRDREGRQAMNSFTLGKLAGIRIKSLVDDADEARRARRATSQCRAPRREYHFIWHKTRVGIASPCGALPK
jgi:hypothetical protein